MLYSHDYTHQDGPEQGRGSASSYQTKVYNFPPVKVFEGEKGFTFFMPCLPLRCRKGLSVLLGNGTLRFFGLRCASRSGDERIATLEEDREERFHKAFQIAVPVRENAVEIVYEDDFLLVWVPKEGNIEASLDGESVRAHCSQKPGEGKPGGQDHSSQDHNSRNPGVRELSEEKSFSNG